MADTAMHAWAGTLAAARVGVRDLSFAEVHDCFTIADRLGAVFNMGGSAVANYVSILEPAR